jgi:hypothetical protein
MRNRFRGLLPLILVLLLLASGPLARSAVPALWGNLDSGPHAVGFRLFEERDPSRAIRLPSGIESRPVRVYVWYPAKPEPDAVTLTFGRYAALADDDIVLEPARERTAFSRRPLARSLGAERYAALLDQPVGAVEGSAAAPGSFPLVVIGQGLYYESPVTHAILAEVLASHGFVVATCPLVGTHSPLVSIDVLDLETQARDMEFVIGRARRLPFVDSGRLGLLGFDMGAHAGVIVAMRNPDVDAFVSLDASILFSDVLEIPVASPHFDPSLLRAPWFHATQRALVAPQPGYEGESLWDTASFSERTFVLVDGVGHVDFTSYTLIEGRSPVVGYWGPPREGAADNYALLMRYVEAFLSAHLEDDAAAREFLARDPQELSPGATMTLEHRAAARDRPTYADFLNESLAGEPSRAVELGRGLRGTPSADKLLEPFFLGRLGSHLHISWQLNEAGLAILELNTKLHPDAADAWAGLAQAQAMTGSNDLALVSLRKAIELDPTKEGLQGFLRFLESRAGE